MNTPFSSAAAAYGNTARLFHELSGAGATPAPSAAPQTDFGQLLADQLSRMIEVGQVSDRTSMAMLGGQASVVDMVTALSQAEATLETMVTVRDRVISAYEEIMRMPI